MERNFMTTIRAADRLLDYFNHSAVLMAANKTQPLKLCDHAMRDAKTAANTSFNLADGRRDTAFHDERRYKTEAFVLFCSQTDHAAALSDSGPRLRRGDVLINQSELIPLNAFDAAIMIRSGQYSGGIEFDSFHCPTLTGGHGSVSVRK